MTRRRQARAPEGGDPRRRVSGTVLFATLRKGSGTAGFRDEAELLPAPLALRHGAAKARSRLRDRGALALHAEKG